MSIKTSELFIPEKISVNPLEAEAGFDGTIPDYCPDIARVIRVDCAPQITACAVEGDTLRVNGKALFDVLYESERRSSLKSCRVSGGFECVSPLPAHAQGDVTASCRAVCDRISCRTADGRRPEIKAAITVFPDVCCERAVSAVVPESGNGVYFLKSEADFDGGCDIYERTYDFEERIPLAQNERPIGEAAFGRITLSPPKAAAGEDKAELKARADLRLIYADESEEGRLCATEKTVPVTAVLDLPGLSPLARVNAEAEITEQNISPELDQYGESRIIKAAFKVKARFFVCEPRTYAVAADMFERGCDDEYETVCVKLPHVVSECEKSFTVEAELPPPTPLFTEILDTAAYCSRGTAERGEGGLLIRGTVTVCVTGETDSGVYSVNHKIPFEQFLQCEFPEGTTGFYANTLPTDVSATLKPDGSFAVKVTCETSITVNADTAAEFVSQITARKEAAGGDDEGTVIFRYPAGNEKLWDIAKEYRVSPEDLAAANPDRFDAHGALCGGSEPLYIA